MAASAPFTSSVIVTPTPPKTSKRSGRPPRRANPSSSDACWPASTGPIGRKPSATSAGERGVARCARRDPDLDLAGGVQDRAQRLALPEGVGSVVGERVLGAVVHQRLAGDDLPHHRHVLAQALVRMAPRPAVPALDDLGARDAEPDDRAVAAGQRIDRQRVHRGGGGGAGGDLDDGGAELDAGREGGEVGERRQGVGAVGLGRPHRVVAERLGPADLVDRDVERGTAVEVEAERELHARMPIAWRPGARRPRPPRPSGTSGRASSGRSWPRRARGRSRSPASPSPDGWRAGRRRWPRSSRMVGARRRHLRLALGDQRIDAADARQRVGDRWRRGVDGSVAVARGRRWPTSWWRAPSHRSGSTTTAAAPSEVTAGAARRAPRGWRTRRRCAVRAVP